MEVIGRIGIEQNKKEYGKKTLLTILLIIIVLSIVLAIALGSAFSLVLIVNFFYLLNMRKKMGKKILFKDVAIRANINDDYKIITIFNSVYYNKKLYSCEYHIPNNKVFIARYNSKSNLLKIESEAQKVLFDGDERISTKDLQKTVIDIFLSEEQATLFAETIKSPLCES